MYIKVSFPVNPRFEALAAYMAFVRPLVCMHSDVIVQALLIFEHLGAVTTHKFTCKNVCRIFAINMRKN